MLEFAIKVAKAPNCLTGENKLSKAAAFLFAFSVLHALPNFLLLSPDGLEKYQAYSDHARSLALLPVFEIYLLVSFVVHVYLAARAALLKPVGWLAVSGSVLMVFLLKHLIDFRFSGNLDSLSLPDTLGGQKIFYALGVASASLHVYKGMRPAWLFNLGFRGLEISRLLILGRLLLAVATVAYLLPLLVT